MHTNGLLYCISDDFGLRSPVIQKAFQPKSDASVVARVASLQVKQTLNVRDRKVISALRQKARVSAPSPSSQSQRIYDNDRSLDYFFFNPGTRGLGL